MQTIQINDIELEDFINSKYGDDQKSLLNDFIAFVKTEKTISEIKTGFDEVEDYKNGKSELSNADDFLSELKSEY